MAENRYIGNYPVIGIRPTIDGRRGPMQLRESLEDQTMAMALAAKSYLKKISVTPTVNRYGWLLPILLSDAYLNLRLVQISSAGKGLTLP